MKLSEKRIEGIHRVLAYYKIVVATLTLMIGIMSIQVRGFAGEDDGVKAAVFALLAASVWILGLIPSDKARVGSPWIWGMSTEVVHLSAAVLTIFAGWNWLEDETNGDAVATLWPALALLFSIVATLTFSVLGTILLPLEERSNKEGVRKWRR